MSLIDSLRAEHLDDDVEATPGVFVNWTKKTITEDGKPRPFDEREYVLLGLGSDREIDVALAARRQALATEVDDALAQQRADLARTKAQAVAADALARAAAATTDAEKIEALIDGLAATLVVVPDFPATEGARDRIDAVDVIVEPVELDKAR